MLSRLAVWYLQKRKKSVIIGFHLKEGELHEKNSTTYFYDNTFENIVIKDVNGKVFNIPDGKFLVRYDYKKNTKKEKDSK
ncbi:hypothetical protein NXG04_07755 [Klebsiella pneumoniae]|nr:hypothetical protein [Klebsiella pneumoniae]MDS7714449.1 hypothetical protein [Klebsiella pneumoniae]